MEGFNYNLHFLEIDDFTSEFYQLFKEEIIGVWWKLFCVIKEEWILSKSCFRGRVTDAKSNTDINKPITHINIDPKTLNTILANQI